MASPTPFRVYRRESPDTNFTEGGFKPDRDRRIYSERKNPEYDFLREGDKAVGTVS